jgi:hypothetical protein
VGYQQPEGGTIPADGGYVPFCPRITRGRAVNEERKALLRKEGCMTGSARARSVVPSFANPAKLGQPSLVVMQAKT